MNKQARQEHTPGPWKLLPGQDLTEIVQPSNGSGHKLITDLSGSPLPQSEIQANAQLIASAPELLRQRDELLSWCELIESRLHDNGQHEGLSKHEVNVFRQAIANAKGGL